MVRSFQEIIRRASESDGSSRGGGRVAVAGAEGKAVLEAVHAACQKKILSPILVGDRSKIEEISKTIGFDLEGIPLIHQRDDAAAARSAVEAVASGQADCLMKGKVATPVLLHELLDRKHGLRLSPLLSHVALMEVPAYHKLIVITDGGMVIQPDLEQKVEIIRNAVRFMNSLGQPIPKVALLAAIETVTPDMPETQHAEAIVLMAQDGTFGDAIIEGPVAADVAFSAQAAKDKGITSRISGDPDILVVPNIACGNILAKSLFYLAKAGIGGLILGAKIPVILLSRSDDARTKLNSMALAVVASLRDRV
jgi:phosphate butyryltransferase